MSSQDVTFTNEARPSNDHEKHCSRPETEYGVMKTLDGGFGIMRLGPVVGDNKKSNEVIFCGEKSSERNVIFFGGDVQDYSENMLAHRDNKHYEKWNLESTAQLLKKRFPGSHIWVVRPSTMHLKTFSAYSNFVESDIMGCPSHEPGQRSWNHLAALLHNSVEKIPGEFQATDDLPLDLVGFSKGCVVLNQLAYDLSSENTAGVADFVKRVVNMYWLDGGHNGGSKTWVTDDNVLQTLADSNIHVHAHVTPYQMNDFNRKWIRREQRKFVEKLKRFGANLTNTLHFEEEERSLDNHFRILTSF